MKWILCIALLSGSAALSADQWHITGEVGTIDLKFDPDVTLNQQSVNDNGLIASLSVGYRFDNHWQLDATLSQAIDDYVFDIFNIADNYRISQWGVGLSYHLTLSESIELIPSVGMIDWRLNGREGAFLNPGPEDRIRFDGNDVYWRLALDFGGNQQSGWLLAVTGYQYEFGNATAVTLGGRFDFE